MLDVRSLRNDLDGVTAALARRRDESLGAEVATAAALDAEVRALNTERDQLRSRINALSQQVGALFRDGRREEAELLPMASRLLSDTALESVGRAMRERRGVVMPS